MNIGSQWLMMGIFIWFIVIDGDYEWLIVIMTSVFFWWVNNGWVMGISIVNGNIDGISMVYGNIYGLYWFNYMPGVFQPWFCLSRESAINYLVATACIHIYPSRMRTNGSGFHAPFSWSHILALDHTFSKDNHLLESINACFVE